jgi:Tol biopolymer transport system component
VSAQNPAPSPDGHWILFTRYRDGYDGTSGGLWKLPSGGGAARPVLDSDGATNVNGLATWAHGEVAYADTSPALDGDIWTVASDGTGRTRLTDSGAVPRHAYQEPTFAPDGRTLAFEDDLDDSRSSDGYVGALAIVPRAGGAARRGVVRGRQLRGRRC